MLIQTKNPNYVAGVDTRILRPSTSRIATPSDYELPVVLIDPNSITPQDEELLQALAEYAPATKFRRGDLAILEGEIPNRLRMDFELIPRVWEVRFVISKWAFEAMLALQTRPDITGTDHLHALLERSKGLDKYQYEAPVIYAHGFPHGVYPNSVAFLRDYNLKRLTMRDPTQPWRTVVEASGAPFHGYDASSIPRPFSFELAPDQYRSGDNIKHPFGWEEPNVEALCAAGFEDVLFDPVVLNRKRKVKAIDRDHDLFGR